MEEGALAGVRVLDMGRVLSAPWAGQLLADLGAEVIKVERPGIGDDARQHGPETIVDAQGNRTANGSMFLCSNRNKQSLTLDFSKPEGRDLLLKLVASSDVVLENFVPGTMARYGLSYDELNRVNPRIILCSLSGYGQTGPKSGWRGYDAVFQAESGMMSVTGIEDGKPGAGPMKTGPSLVDVCTGVYAASGILAALYARERTGVGQVIDVTLLETALAMQTLHIQNYLLTGEQPLRRGNEGNGGHPARNFDCADGAIYLSVGTSKQYHDLCRVIGRPDLASDERFQDNPGRMKYRKEFNAIFEPIVAGLSCHTLAADLVAAGIPNGIIKEYDAVIADEQVLARESIRTLPHDQSAAGEVKLVASPLRLSRNPLVYHSVPPKVGEHSDIILQQLLGLDTPQIDALRNASVV